MSKLPAKPKKTDPLRERCQQLSSRLTRDTLLRQGNPVDTIYEFVIAELGRSASTSLRSTEALVLYFKNEEDREQYIHLVQKVNPTFTARKVP